MDPPNGNRLAKVIDRPALDTLPGVFQSSGCALFGSRVCDGAVVHDEVRRTCRMRDTLFLFTIENCSPGVSALFA